MQKKYLNLDSKDLNILVKLRSNNKEFTSYFLTKESYPNIKDYRKLSDLNVSTIQKLKKWPCRIMRI